jgi:hypothetical protein
MDEIVYDEKQSRIIKVGAIVTVSRARSRCTQKAR